MATVEAACRVALDDGTLTRWRPTRPTLQPRGVLLLARPAWERMQGDWMIGGESRESLRSQTEAAFDVFVEEGRAQWRMFAPIYGRLAMAQMKIMSPSPGSRLIGAFLDADTYVGLRLFWRDELPFKAAEPRWRPPGTGYRDLGIQAVAEWDAILPTAARVPMPLLFGGRP